MGRRDDRPFFYERNVPWDEYILALLISMDGALEASHALRAGYTPFDRWPHERIIEWVAAEARRPSNILRRGWQYRKWTYIGERE